MSGYCRQYRRGDIVYVEKFLNQIGSEQHSGRPAIIVSSDDMNGKLDTVEIVYCTTQPKEVNGCHVEVTSTPKKSTVLCEQVSTVDKSRLHKRVGRCTEEEMERIGKAIVFSLDILTDDTGSTAELIRIRAERDTYKKMYERLLKEISHKNTGRTNSYRDNRSNYHGRNKHF